MAPPRSRCFGQRLYGRLFGQRPPSDEVIEVDVRADNTSIFISDKTLKIQPSTQFDDASQEYVDGSNTLLADSISVHVRLIPGATGGAGLIIGFHYYIP